MVLYIYVLSGLSHKIYLILIGNDTNILCSQIHDTLIFPISLVGFNIIPQPHIGIIQSKLYGTITLKWCKFNHLCNTINEYFKEYDSSLSYLSSIVTQLLGAITYQLQSVCISSVFYFMNLNVTLQIILYCSSSSLMFSSLILSP